MFTDKFLQDWYLDFLSFATNLCIYFMSICIWFRYFDYYRVMLDLWYSRCFSTSIYITPGQYPYYDSLSVDLYRMRGSHDEEPMINLQHVGGDSAVDLPAMVVYNF